MTKALPLLILFVLVACETHRPPLTGALVPPPWGFTDFCAREKGSLLCAPAK